MADMSFEIKVDNTADILKATDEAIYNALDTIGNKAADYAAGLAPVKSGNLKGSMTSEVHMEEKAVYVGTDVDYASSIEFGHHQKVGRYVPAIGKRLVREFIPGKPFLKPAMERHLDEYKHILEEELNI
jgi:phage gpG-like protein